MTDKLRPAASIWWDRPCYKCRSHTCDMSCLEQEPEQEPVAWTTMPEAEDWCFVSLSKDPTGKLEGKWFPLYTAPPRREWVGLTDEEITQGNRDSLVDLWAWESAVLWAEAKLKDKNGG